MSLQQRVIFTAGCLGAAALAQWGLQSHLARVADQPMPTLTKPLKDLPYALTAATPEGPRGSDYPLLLGHWKGMDHPGRATLAEQIPFADEFIYRAYIPEAGTPQAAVYMIYSSTAKDRDHHPEVCVRDVAGAREDTQTSGIVFLDEGRTRPVQRFRFLTGPDESTVIYYWHYTLNPPPEEGASGIQKLHLRLARKVPSVTVQVSTRAGPEELRGLETTLLVALDREMVRNHLPAGAAIGCDRVPIQVIRP